MWGLIGHNTNFRMLNLLFSSKNLNQKGFQLLNLRYYNYRLEKYMICMFNKYIVFLII